ncbi:MAG: RnfABCDGE type electron transport complex subunit D [Clostridiales bacterium]|nr:RnfABCDGE type electron transport complex subunit D [Clostridiales bacterium]
MADKLLKFSSSPHVKAVRTTKQIMRHVCIALLPACIAGVVFFGLNAALLIALSLTSAILSEVVYHLICGKKLKEIYAGFDYTSAVTGLLIALSVGVQTPWYAIILANIFAIVVVKMIFGGTGKNLVNPAVTGRIFAFMSFLSLMSNGWVNPNFASLSGASSINAETNATLLTDLLKGNAPALSNLDLLLGTGLAGCIGETCKVALILGGIYLAVLGIINIGYPAIYIAVTGLFTVCLNGFDFNCFLPAILSGGLMLGAIFMATDYTTSPNTTLGNIVYFALLGLLTAGLRQATGIEVVSFVILLMNLFVPLIDKFVRPKPFGFQKQKGGKK